MSKSKPTQRKTTIELTARGVFQISTARAGETERKKIARLIRLRAVGRRESDGVTFAQIRFRTMHGDYRSELFTWSKLLPKNRDEIKNKLAELGYEWPENEALTGEILKRLRIPRRNVNSASSARPDGTVRCLCVRARSLRAELISRKSTSTPRTTPILARLFWGRDR